MQALGGTDLDFQKVESNQLLKTGCVVIVNVEVNFDKQRTRRKRYTGAVLQPPVTCAQGYGSCKTTRPRSLQHLTFALRCISCLSWAGPGALSVQGWMSDRCDGFVECTALAVFICSSYFHTVYLQIAYKDVSICI
jgi:hypothetical protein